jgi:hypothetical protein
MPRRLAEGTQVKLKTNSFSPGHNLNLDPKHARGASYSFASFGGNFIIASINDMDLTVATSNTIRNTKMKISRCFGRFANITLKLYYIILH